MSDESASRASVEPEDDLVGWLLDGKYRVEAAVARGGIGQVYRGMQEPLGRPVAIKVLAPRDRDADSLARHEKRFFREASVSSRLSHPNTVTIHDYGALPEGRGFYLVMEYLDGRTLAELVRAEGPLGTRRALHIARQMASSLSEAHAAGVVHRDLKPGNVLLVPRGGDPDFVKVVDFGLVKTLDERKGEDVTQEGAIVGTPLYMPPEQFIGAPVDARSDVYALGVVLYEMLTGRPPFVRPDGAQDHSDIILGHMTRRPPAFRMVRPELELPAGVEAVVLKCLQKRPADRYGSMAELLEALAESGATLPRPVADLPEATTGLDQPSRRPPPPERRSRAGLWAIVMALPLTAGVAWWALRTPEAVDPPSASMAPAEPPAARAAAQATAVPAPAPLPAAVAAAEVAPARDEVLTVVFHTIPDGAEVWDGETRLGPTPLRHALPREVLGEAGRRFEVRKAGYLTESHVQRQATGSEVVVRLRLTPEPPREAAEVREVAPEPQVEPKVEPKPAAVKKRPKPGGLEIKGER